MQSTCDSIKRSYNRVDSSLLRIPGWLERVLMCCFSREIESVSNTTIFARDSTNGKQFLVYEMSFVATEDLAMILPIPVPRQTPENAVRFIDLKAFPEFFLELDSGFPQPKPARGEQGALADKPAQLPLEVVNVGAFEASFVPAVIDFARLDARFRLPTETWGKLPQYRSFGFAVFKLRKGQHESHPMAFEFPRANPRQLFFPTVHIHDGKVHEKADFDHTLYAQFGEEAQIDVQRWRESAQPAGMFVNIAKCKGLVNKNAHLYKRTIVGLQKNEDLIA